MSWSHKYLEVVRSLDLDIAEDHKATLILDKVIKPLELKPLESLIKGQTVIVFGCGPSLENDLNKIWDAGIHKRCVLIAADGAAKALLKYNIVPHVNVTDLDGDLQAILKANLNGAITMVEAHAQNIRTVLKFLPYLKGTVYGTTHSEPTGKVYNFGGFTDGDRAVHIAAHFNPAMIILAGMDFGHVVGVYSGTYDPVKKPRGLMVGKKQIEELAAHTKIHMFNFTSSGENIHHVPPITLERLKQVV